MSLTARRDVMKVEDLFKNRKEYIEYILKYWSWLRSGSDDIIQNVFIYLYNRFGDKEIKEEDLENILFSKIYYETIDHIRKYYDGERTLTHGDYIFKETRYGDVFDFFPSIQRKTYDVNVEVLLMLTSKKRSLMLTDFYLKGCNYKDLMSKYNVTLGTVKKTLSTGRDQIRTNLKKLKEFVAYV